MIESVLLFAALSAAFEFVVLMKLAPRTRLRLLGSRRWVSTIHTVVIMGNILIHYGTFTGSMVAIVSGLASFATIPFAKWLCGSIRAGRYYPGVLTYHPQQLTRP